MDEKYFVAKITTDMPDPETGKIKKMTSHRGQASISVQIILLTTFF